MVLFLYGVKIDLSALKVGFSVLFSDFADDFAGISVGDHVCGNILCDNTSRADDAVVPDGNARKHHHPRTKPTVAPDVDGGVELIDLLP